MNNQQENTDFVRARSTFTDKTKTGGDKITLYLGIDDLNQLRERIEAEATGEGIKIQVFINVSPKDGKKRGSLLVSDPQKKGARPAASAGQSTGPKKFAYKPKSPVKALG